MDYECSLSTISDTAVTSQLICAFDIAYAKSRFSHDAAQLNRNFPPHLYRYVISSDVETKLLFKGIVLD